MSRSTAAGWQPTLDHEILHLRARLLADIRGFFAARGVLEVDTPALSATTIPDPNIHSFITRYHGPGPRHGKSLYLQTSPEFSMKQLLAAGSGDIYQLAKVFRDGEMGAYHNPEFTLLEWYRLGFDHRRLIDEVAELVSALLASRLSGPPLLLSYRDAFMDYLGIDPLTAPVTELRARAEGEGVAPRMGLAPDDPDPWRDLLLSVCIEPQLPPDRLVFLHEYPASQAALARIRPGPSPVAERFELYCGGLELANGFHELTDPVEQRRRFDRDNQRRVERGLAPVPVDEHLLAALFELPDCAGVALGVDRLVLLAAGAASLDDVLSFPFTRA